MMLERMAASDEARCGHGGIIFRKRSYDFWAY
jgi:hypothetical protein